MRKIVALIFLLLSINCFSQDTLKVTIDREDFPAYVLNEKGDTVGIIFTISHVRIIDKNLEILDYLEGMQQTIDTTQFYYVSLVGELQVRNATLETKIVTLTSELNLSKGNAEDLADQLKDAATTDKNNKEIINNNKKIVSDLEKDVLKQKLIKWVAISVATLVTILSITSQER